MKLFKRISVVLLSIIAAFSFSMFVACTNDNSSGGNNLPPVTPPAYELIAFDQTEASMVVGDEKHIIAKTTDSSKIINFVYASSNESVATVDQKGLVVAKAKGQTVISATYGNFKAECTVTVSHGNLLPQISIDNIASALVVPKTVDYALNPYVIFNGKKFYNATFSYETSNSNVSINQTTGVITGVNVGTAEVTVKASWDGVSGIPAMQKTFTVKVTSAVQMYINGGSTSSVVIYNKVLDKLNGVQTTMTADFNVIAKDIDNNPLTPSIEVLEQKDVNGNDASIVSYADGTLTGTGVLGTAVVKVSVGVDDTTFDLYVDVLCDKAVGDYMTAGGTEYNTVDFNTLIGDIDVAGIFGEDTTLVSAMVGREELTLDGNKIVEGITGNAFTTPDSIIVTLYDDEVGYNVEILPYVFKDAIEDTNKYYFSSYNGDFFDEDFKYVDVENILGDGKLIKEAYVRTAEGQLALRVSADGTQLLGAEAYQDPNSSVYFAVATEDSMVYVEANPYTLIIDEMVDFDYFIVKDGSWSFKPNKFTITSGLEWNGNYVLANDIDALDYYSPNAVNPTRFQGQEKTFTYLNWLGTAYQEAHFSTTLGIKEREGNEAKIGYGDKAFTGLFDGRGHVIKNYTPTVGGLFQVLNGGIVRNVGFLNCNPANNAGVLCGTAFNSSTIENVFIYADQENGYGNSYAGGYLTSGIGKSVKLKNIVFIGESNKINYGAGNAGVFDQDKSSSYASGTDSSNVYMVTPLPAGFTKSGTSAIARADATYVDGIKVTDETITLISNARRYTSLAKFEEDVTASNLDMSGFDSSIWTLLNGKVPVFTSALAFEYLRIDAGEYIASENGTMLTVGETIPVEATYRGVRVDDVDTLILNSGAEFVEIVDGYKIKGIAKGTATFTASYEYEGQTLTKDFVINVVPAIENAAEEYYFSAYDGRFFKLNADNTYSVIDDALNQIFGKETSYEDLFVAYNADGIPLEIDSANGMIKGIKAGKGEFGQTYVDLYTATEGKRVNLKTATLIIDEAEDFEYFTLKNPVDYHITTSHTYTFQGNDFVWDGYYVLANDIDASEYGVHDLDNGKVYKADGAYNLRCFVASRVEYLAYGGGIKDRGMIGTFDGRGYVIKNLETTATGLLGYIGGTVKNVGFENCKATANKYSFLAYGIYGAKAVIQDVYVLTTESTVDSYSNPLISTWGQKPYVKNVIIEDRTVLNDSVRNSEYNYGSLMSQAINDASTKTPIEFTTSTFSNLFVLSDKALSVTVPANVNGSHGGKHTVNIDAQYVNGVQIPGKYYAQNVRRYTSGLEMSKDTTNDYTAFNSDVWQVINNVPVFKRRSADTLVAPLVNGSSANVYNTLIGESLEVKVLNTYAYVDADSITVTNGTATATVDGTSVIVGESAGSFTLNIVADSLTFNITVNVAKPDVYVDGVLLKVDEIPVVQGGTTSVSLKAYGLDVEGVTLETATASDLVSISNNVVTATSSATGKVVINVKYNGYLLDTFTVNVLANCVELPEEYTLSASEGLFFDANGNQVDALEQITDEILSVVDAEGNGLTYEDGKILGVKVTKSGMVKTSLIITTADSFYKINVKAATLVIDEAEDLQYFTLTEAYTTSGGPAALFKFGENDFKWDGYYVLVKNIDASNYVHDWTGGVAAEIDTVTFTTGGETLNATDILSYYRQVGNVKEFDSNGDYLRRGFSGTLDGQGYTISNLTTGKSGLLGMIIKGTVKNIGFVNNGVVNNEGGFLAYGVTTSSVVRDIFVSTNNGVAGNGYAPLVSKLSSHIWEFAKNSVIIDNTVTPTTPATVKTEMGSYDANAKRWADDHDTYGSGSGSGWIWGENYALVVSNKPLSGYINTNSSEITPFIDTLYLDGELNTNSAVKLREVLNVIRYSSMETITAAYANNSAMYDTILSATNYFEIYNGVPVFKSAVGLMSEDNCQAYLDETVVSTTTANQITKGEQVTVRIKSNGVLLTQPPVSITVNSGNELVTVAGATITAVNPGTVNVTVVFGTKSWTFDIVIAKPIIEYAQELTLSATEGILFDASGNIVDFSDITTETMVSITDAQGNALTLNDGKVMGVKHNKSGLLEDVIIYTGEDNVYKIYVKSATLAIDEAEDLRYFTLTEAYTTSGGANGSNAILTFGENDFKWDGYYVLVKNIDATGYVHDWTGGVAEDLDKVTMSYKGETLNVTDMWGYFATLGNVKEYADKTDDGVQNLVQYSYKGFMGVLDGQGYTLSNLTTGKSGLLGVIYGGQVKNVGFVNNQVANNEGGFLAYGIVGGRDQVMNVYVSTTNGVAGKDFAPLVTKVSSHVWELGRNSIIIDNTTLPTTPATVKTEMGSYDSNAKRIDVTNDHYMYGSNPGDAWQYGTNNTIVVSSKPLSGYIEANSTEITPFLDAHTVDGVENTNSATKLYSGLKVLRYTSMEKAIEAYATGNATFTAVMSTGLFEVYQGIPVFKSAKGLITDASYNAYFGEKVVSTTETNVITKDDVVNVRIKANGLLYTDPVVTVTVNSGSEFVTVEGTAIKAVDAGTANITVTYGTLSWTFDVLVKVPIVEHEEDLTLSAYDGILFDANGNVVELTDITTAEILKVTDAQGNELTIDNGTVLGATSNKSGLLEDSLMIYTADLTYKVNVKVATLAIDEAEDLRYFTLTEAYTTSGGATSILTFGENDFKWDGYYVLVKNIDATGYTHDWTGGVAEELSNVTMSYSGATLNVTDMWGYFGTLGNVKEYADKTDDGVKNHVQYSYKGFMGVLDGQGYTLSNLTTGKSGLLGVIYGGQVKNVGFVNNQVANNEGGFLAYGIVGGRDQVMNVYVSTTNGVAGKDFAPLVTKVSSHVWELGRNSIIIDNTTLPTTPATVKTELGSYDSNAKRIDVTNDHYMYGSNPGDGWQYGTNNTIVISSKPLSGYIEANSTEITPFLDAHTVDDVANTNSATKLYSGLKVLRYTSMEKAIEAYATGNATFTAVMSTGLFEVYQGIPVFKSAKGLITDASYNAYFGEKVVSTTETNVITKDDVVNVRIKADGLLFTDPVATITINGEDQGVVSVNGTTITALKDGIANITVSFDSKSWTFDVEVVVPIDEYAEDLTLSAYDGILFDANGNVVEVTDITSAEILKVTDAQGNELTLTDGKVLGATSSKAGLVENSLMLYTADVTYKVNVKVATLAIDEAEDLRYFTLTEAYTTSGGPAALFKFGEDDFKWNGYYVLVKNIDATGYVHDWTGGVAAELDTVTFTSSGNKYNAVKIMDYYATVGNMKVYGDLDNNTETPNTTEEYRGFMGVLDGQGYTLSNLTTGRSGLLGMITTGKVKNIGFINNGVVNNEGGFLAYGISKSTRAIENVYVSTNNGVVGNNFGPLVSKISSHVWEVGYNSIIIDNTVLPENPAVSKMEIGSYDSNAVRYDTSEKLGDHDTYGSGNASAWQYGTNNTIVISSKPLNGYIETNSTSITPFIDAHTVDGVTNTNSATKLYSGLKVLRYTSMEKAIEACASYNPEDKKAVFTGVYNAIMGTGLFELYQGIPVIKSAKDLITDASYNAYFGEKVVSTTEANLLTIGDEVNVRIKADGLLFTEPKATVTVNDGAEFVTVEDTKITANATGTATITIAYGEYSWTIQVIVSGVNVNYERELQFSAYDGLFFDGDTIVDVSEIVEGEDVLGVTANDGTALTYSDGKILGFAYSNEEWVENIITIKTAEVNYNVTVKIAELIIDEASDFEYFTIKEAWTKTGSYNLQFAENDFKWDGYFVLAKNIDATGYNHVLVQEAGTYGTSSITELSSLANAADLEVQWTQGNFRITGTFYHGFLGCFDGQGYTISNLNTDRSGLLGIVAGGVIKNVGLVNNMTSPVGGRNGAVMARAIVGSSKIENVFVVTNSNKSHVTTTPFITDWGFSTYKVNNFITIDNFAWDMRYAGANSSHGSMFSDTTRASDKDSLTFGTSATWSPAMTNAVIISKMPLNMSTEANVTANEANTANMDAQYIDGVLNTNTYMVKRNKVLTESGPVGGVYRYTDVSKYVADTANKAQQFIDTGLFTLLDGFPVMTSAIDVLKATGISLYVDGAKTENGATIEVAKGSSVTVSGKALGTPMGTTATIVSGGDKVSMSGLTVTANALGDAQIQVVSGGTTFTLNVTVIKPTLALEEQLTLSASEGVFFDSDGNVYDVSTFLGDRTYVSMTDHKGNALTWADGLLTGATVSKFAEYNNPSVTDRITGYYIDYVDLTFETEDTFYVIKAKVADKVIDEKEDLAMFTVSTQYSTTGTNNEQLTFAENEFNWNGYYVLVKNVDATGYTHDWASGEVTELADYLFTYSGGVQLNVAQMSHFAQVGNIKSGNKGFTGVLDGQGYTLSNLTTGRSGLFGLINGGRIQNIGFVNNQVANNEGGFLAYGAWGGFMKNSYVYTNDQVVGKDFAPVVSKSSPKVSLVMNDCLVIDNTTLPTEAVESRINVGSFDSNSVINAVTGESMHYVVYTNYNQNLFKCDPIIVSNKPWSGYIETGSNVVTTFRDVKTVDGVVLEDFDGRLDTNGYDNTTRYTSLKALNSAYEANSSLYADLLATGWFEVVEGAITFKTANA